MPPAREYLTQYSAVRWECSWDTTGESKRLGTSWWKSPGDGKRTELLSVTPLGKGRSARDTDVTAQCAPSAKTSVHHKSAHSGTTAHNTHRHFFLPFLFSLSFFPFFLPFLSSLPSFLPSARLSHAQHGTCTHERDKSPDREVRSCLLSNVRCARFAPPLLALCASSLVVPAPLRSPWPWHVSPRTPSSVSSSLGVLPARILRESQAAWLSCATSPAVTGVLERFAQRVRGYYVVT